jgi:hypothetical protein
LLYCGRFIATERTYDAVTTKQLAMAVRPRQRDYEI